MKKKIICMYKAAYLLFFGLIVNSCPPPPIESFIIPAKPTLWYYVASYGDDANSGLTADEPFLTLNRAARAAALDNDRPNVYILDRLTDVSEALGSEETVFIINGSLVDREITIGGNSGAGLSGARNATGSNKCILRIEQGARVVLRDITIESGNSGGVVVDRSASVVMHSGLITNNAGALLLLGESAFTMYGGSIEANSNGPPPLTYTSDYIPPCVVWVGEPNTRFRMAGDAKFQGNSGGVAGLDGAIIFMEDRACISDNRVLPPYNHGTAVYLDGASLFMRGNSAIGDNRFAAVQTRLSSVIAMEDNAAIYNNDDSYAIFISSYCTFRMTGSTEIFAHPRVALYMGSIYGDDPWPRDSGASAIIGGNARIHHNGTGIGGSICELLMTDNASVSHNSYESVRLEMSDFTMNKKASITDNRSYSGGVYIQSGYDNDEFMAANFTMADEALIARNTNPNPTTPGGGVYLEGGNATFTMTGGSIINNSCGGNGGGVFVGAERNVEISHGPIGHGAVFTLLGGTISGNSSMLSGGGVAVTKKAVFTKSALAVIYGQDELDGAKRNTAGTGGAAVWVEDGIGAGSHTSLNKTVGPDVSLEPPYNDWSDLP